MSFVIENRRWLATGAVLTFGSSFGQTWFISLFAGEVRGASGLSDGDWGGLYTVATLASAALLLSRGGLADTMPLNRLVVLISGLFALACLGIAFGQSIWILGLSVFLLRFCGQGMFTHMGVTAMGRWFVASRGKAVAIANLGHPLGEMLLPFPVVVLIGLLGWRGMWGLTAALILVVLMPLLLWLLSRERQPRGMAEQVGAPGLHGHHWRRAEVLRHWFFWAILPFVLTPGFIGTVVFFHQVHVAEVKGWSLLQMAPGYPAFAGATVVTSLVAGWACDRFGPERLLPILLVPMGTAMTLIGPAEAAWGWILALGIVGISQGMSGALWGALLPKVYGTDHLGAVRAVVVAAMVFSTAAGPGITGWLIDRGVTFPEQGAAMALWCFALSLAAIPLVLRYRRQAAG